MILNLTQHPSTSEQRAQGVVDLQGEALEALKQALTFDEIPPAEEIAQRAQYIAELACNNGLGGDDGDDPIPRAAMIGGALWLMGPLTEELYARGIQPLFAFSKRQVVEKTMPDGSVQKVATFAHIGFVNYPD